MYRLEEQIRGRVLYHEPMARHTSYRIGGPADVFIEPADVEDLTAAVRVLRREGVPVLLLGMGTNLLVRDGGIRGGVVAMKGINRIEREGEATIYAESGAPLTRVVRRCAQWALSGLEALSGIPGSIGGAIAMNAGAHGTDMGHVVESVRLLTRDGKAIEKKRRELVFEYRKCRLGQGDIILGARLSLTKGDRERISRLITERLAWRKGQQPLTLPSAGSVFKNPPEGPAGLIIDELGFKGTIVGGAQVSPVHANFIVNRHAATASDVLSLIDRIRREVREKRGIDLDLEVKIIGEDS